MAQMMVHKDGDTTIEILTNPDGDYMVTLSEGIQTEWCVVFNRQDEHKALARYLQAIADDLAQYTSPSIDGTHYTFTADYRLV